MESWRVGELERSREAEKERSRGAEKQRSRKGEKASSNVPANSAQVAVSSSPQDPSGWVVDEHVLACSCSRDSPWGLQL